VRRRRVNALLDTVLLVRLRVVVAVALENDTLVPGEVARVDSNTVVEFGVTSTDATPVACEGGKRKRSSGRGE
jgi:hypothetical protein